MSSSCQTPFASCYHGIISLWRQDMNLDYNICLYQLVIEKNLDELMESI